MLDWGDERYVRVYTRDTPGWLMLTWEGRALQLLLERKLDRAGVIDFAEYAEEALAEAVAALVLAPVELVRVGLPQLLARGTFEMNGTFLVMPNFLKAQTAASTSTERSRALREKERDVKRYEQRKVPRGDVLSLPAHVASQNGTTHRELGEAQAIAGRNVALPNGPPQKPAIEPDEDIPDDLGALGAEGETVTKRPKAGRNVASSGQAVPKRDATPSRRDSVLYRAVPYPSVASPEEAGEPAAPDPEPEQTPPIRNGEKGTLERCCEAYAQGISSVTGQLWGFPTEPKERDAVRTAVATFEPGRRDEALYTWVRSMAASFRASIAPHEAKFQKGFAPSKWLEWLNTLPRVAGRVQPGIAATAAPEAFNFDRFVDANGGRTSR